MELTFLIGNIALIFTIASNFAGLPICWRFYKRKSTSEVSVVPFIAGATCTFLWLHYGYFKGDPTVIIVNVIAVFLQSCYTLCFYIYTNNKKNTRKLLLLVISSLALLYAYYFKASDVAKVTQVTGILASLGSILACAAPLVSIKEVFRMKSTHVLPLPLIMASFTVTSLWLFYGILVKDYFLQAPNFVGVLLSGFQLCLFTVFPSKSFEEKSK